jgi:hypothetical protein
MLRSSHALSFYGLLLVAAAACGDSASPAPKHDDAGTEPGDGDNPGDGDGDTPGDGDKPGDGDGGKPSDGDGSTDGGAGDGDVDGDENPDGGAGDGDGDSDSVTKCLADASPVLDSRTEVLELHGQGLSVGFARHVEPDVFGTSGSTVWLPQRFALARAELSLCLGDANVLSYTISHHNFADDFVASDHGVTYTLTQRREDYDKPMFFALDAKKGAQVLWGPVALTLDRCHELLDDEDCTEKYK